MSIIEKIASAVMKRAVKKYLRLVPSTLSLPPASDETPLLLYIHIPFCLTLCPYCSFHKFRFDEPSAKRYFELLHQEMRMVHALGYRFDSIYFGGGTTTILPHELGETIDLAKSLFAIREVSCESDPSHLSDLENADLHGKIDRLSIGIQSFNDRHLQKIGRYKKFGSADEQYAKVSAVLGDFPIVNIDMIYNYPDQSEEELHREIDTILRLRPPQVTFYPLMYAPGIRENLSKRWGKLSDSKDADFYRIIMERMRGIYTQRSSWAWSLEREGIIDEYVIERSEYVGIGSGAFSFIGDTLYANTFSLPAYADRISKEQLPITHATTFPPRAIRQYRMMVEMFGLQDSKQHLWIENTLLKMCGMVENDHVNERGAHLFSVMMREFYNGMDYVRETMRKDLTKEDGILH
ncbi:MAG: coproporphyrinogen III oxidase family protein [Sulfuricurvum sp.]|uniref:coproporphyrinogen III oxidase family protein n=1 Tax=Sulfuricurvum sp. TaxID=2025608 RepID=UPI0026054A4F|nr:coproporphyrinogen III oxidase family protein [Sulfuricurvum sp.]MDD2368763.1 coproporphyrinogen III oxidase family protein [Sulfuricurvum sp.]MDD2950619.1 coproporphyrinogen III oxidase family protein [Sulfuricurvum sp.]MDD5119330.1 coproporphyrinogen III oxidase family protein [Sulfuricurvum sp.]